MKESVRVLRLGNHKRTCVQCRMRKVRCDGQSPACSHCRRLGYNCSLAALDDYYMVHQDDLTPSKKRRSNACHSCRKRKGRCTGEESGCSNCARLGTECVYPSVKRGQETCKLNDRSLPSTGECLSEPVQAEIPTEAFSPSFLSPLFSVTSPFPSPSSTTANFISVDILERYFQHIYPLPSYSFLHFRTLRQKCLDGILDEALALAIHGIVALQCPSPETFASEGDGSSSIEHAESLIFRQLENASMPRLQSIILVMRHRIETKQFQRAFMLAGIAGRFATALHLNDERYDLDAIPQEVRRRTMWSFKLLETYFSIGLEYELWPFENIYLKYPCRELEFSTPEASLDPFPLESNQEATDDFGAYSCCVRFISLRRDIMKLNRTVSISSAGMPELPQLIVEIEGALVKAKAHMPEPDFTVLIRTNNPWLPRYVMMFASWHQCHCDLYRLLLHGHPDSAPVHVLNGLEQAHLVRAEDLCMTHASQIIQMLAELNLNSVQHLTLEYDTAICAYHATRMVLFLAKHGQLENRPSHDFAISRAELCLASLNRFFSPILVKPIVEGIRQSLRSISYSQHSDDPEREVLFNSRLSWAAQMKNRLAIHSLLRQAEFHDDEGTEATG